jgi:hypothetical protein
MNNFQRYFQSKILKSTCSSLFKSGNRPLPCASVSMGKINRSVSMATADGVMHRRGGWDYKFVNTVFSDRNRKEDNLSRNYEKATVRCSG